jgi:hypothetical protein
VGGKKYSMMEMMKTIKKMVAHYIFPWKDDYIYVDHGIEDYKYKQPKGMVAATEFYQNRYYKILKRFRWDIKAEHKTELMDIVHELSYYNALIKRIDLINKIETYGVFPESEVLRLKKKLDDEAKTNFEWKDYDELEEKLGKKLDREAQKYVEHYFPLLLDNVVTRRYKLYAMNAADNSKQSNLSPKIPVTPPNSPASAKKLSPSSFKSTAKISKGSAKSSAKNSPKNSPKSPNRTSKNSARVSPKN